VFAVWGRFPDQAPEGGEDSIAEAWTNRYPVQEAFDIINDDNGLRTLYEVRYALCSWQDSK
jgi:hypothetical protein